MASESEEDSYDEDKEPKTIEELKLKAYNLADKKEIKKKIERERALEPRGKNRNPKQVMWLALCSIIMTYNIIEVYQDTQTNSHVVLVVSIGLFGFILCLFLYNGVYFLCFIFNRTLSQYTKTHLF